MNAGDRKYRIVVERRDTTTDAYGGNVETWTVRGTHRADVRFSKGNERRQAAQEGSTAAATFVVAANERTRAISVTDRIQYDGGTWDVTSNIPSRAFQSEREIEGVRALT